ncbi:MAG: sugar phosphate isomerase/epimerase [Clostridia bacterium]|nr:sugar phosphate isomerase/epimerase [Clostridia bacterium]
MYKLLVGKSVGVRLDGFSQTLADLKAAGFDALDADLCEGGFLEGEDDIALVKSRLAEISKSGLILNGVHLPYGGTRNVAHLDDSMREEAIRRHLEMIALADTYKPRAYILHGSWEPVKDEERAEGLRRMVEAVNYMQTKTQTPIALESLPRTCLLNTAAEMLDVAKKLNKPYFCLDVNHFLQETTESVIPKIGQWIVTTHISDHDYINERHLMPGKGKIAWQKVIAALEQVGYQGVWNYELRADEYACMQDIKDNFDSLFGEYNG